MKVGNRLNKKVWPEISFFLKREMSITLVFWLIVFLIVMYKKLNTTLITNNTFWLYFYTNLYLLVVNSKYSCYLFKFATKRE
jgi:hypothetical protein